jgi:hypothetical protein
MIPFYCVVQKVCVICDQTPFNKNFEYFYLIPITFTAICPSTPLTVVGTDNMFLKKNNDNIVSDLVSFMFEQPKNCVWIAHNGG